MITIHEMIHAADQNVLPLPPVVCQHWATRLTSSHPIPPWSERIGSIFVFDEEKVARNKSVCIWMFPKIGVPQNGWFIMENPIEMDVLGVPPFKETPVYIYTYIPYLFFECEQKFIYYLSKHCRSWDDRPFTLAAYLKCWRGMINW